jgi:hypothetical protein
MNNVDVSLLLGTCLIPGILEEFNIPNDKVVEFIDKFYRSRLFNLMKEEKTAVWHLSARTLADIYSEEQKTGKLNLPEFQ